MLLIKTRNYSLTVTWLVAAYTATRADQDPVKPSQSQDLSKLQIEDPMKIKVTSDAKSEQSLDLTGQTINLVDCSVYGKATWRY